MFRNRFGMFNHVGSTYYHCSWLILVHAYCIVNVLIYIVQYTLYIDQQSESETKMVPIAKLVGHHLDRMNFLKLNVLELN